MTEERIKELANKKLQELDISGKYMQPDDWSTLRVWAEDFAATVADEAREEGIEEMYKEAVIVTQAHPGLEPELRMVAERLKEKG